jgi:hypothetical protein
MFERRGNRNGRDWTAYSAKIQLKDGTEHPKYFQFGFERPPFKEGDYVQFQATDKDANAMSVDPNTVRVSKNPPARPQAQQSGGNGGGQRRGGGGGASARDKYWEDKDRYDKEEREPRIRYQAARRDAIDLVTVLSANDGLPIPKAQGKANVAKRFEEIMLIVEKLTAQFYHDTETLRVLERVADGGAVNVGGDGELPDSDEFDGEQPSEEPAFLEDDEPF